MVSELVCQSYCFDANNERITLRYDLTALLKLERSGLSYEDIFAERITGKQLVQFLEAGSAREVDAVGVFRTLGAMDLWEHIRAAVMLSLPVRDPLCVDIPESNGEPLRMERLRCLICDIMRKSEEFFWSSTLRELFERWQEFAEVKGYAEQRERMQMFDDEGLELYQLTSNNEKFSKS